MFFVHLAISLYCYIILTSDYNFSSIHIKTCRDIIICFINCVIRLNLLFLEDLIQK
jgi:hypothetical protein